MIFQYINLLNETIDDCCAFLFYKTSHNFILFKAACGGMTEEGLGKLKIKDKSISTSQRSI